MQQCSHADIEVRQSNVIHSLKRLFSYTILLSVLLGLLAACGGGPNAKNTTPIELVEVTAPTSTSLRVVFSGAVGRGAETPGNYTITAPGGSSLGVLAAYLSPDGTTVTLATELQQQVTYTLTINGIKAAIDTAARIHTADTDFGGSGEKAPIVASAIALSNTEVLVTFADPSSGKAAEMSDSALNIKYYDIIAEGGEAGQTPDLTITDISFVEATQNEHHGDDDEEDDDDERGRRETIDRSRVILTTEAQQDRRYTVKVTNVVSEHGDKLLDPFNNTATFNGIPVNDSAAPQVLSAIATSNTAILVSFSEPVDDKAGDASHYSIKDAEGNPLAVTAASLNEFNTQVTLTTLPQAEGVQYTLTITSIADRKGNPIDPTANSALFTGISSLGPPNADTDPPRVRSAASTGNTTVIVTFSEPVQGGEESAENPVHYSIFTESLNGQEINPQSVVLVKAAVLDPDDPSKVVLTTWPQSGIVYKLRVTDVQDLAGNQVAPPDRDHPFQVTFRGTGTSGPRADSDGDGLSDAGELAGWTVTVTQANGQIGQSEVTSDPTNPDTDADGMSDLDELVYLINPRSPDTDGDDLTDYQELNLLYSEPTVQDTDEDGLPDGLEFNSFKISPILADTDGDQFSDYEEVTNDNRDPRIADLPELRISIGEVSLTLDELYTYTDTEGKTQSIESSTSTTLEQGTNQTYGTSDVDTTSSAIEESAKVGVSATFPNSIGVSAEASITSTEGQEYQTTVSEETSKSTNEAYNESLAKAQSIESQTEVTRKIEDAAIRVAVTVKNNSDVAFSVSNLEITALQQDPIDRSRSVPVATLISSVALNGGAPTYNIGPNGQVGPLVFKNRDVFVSTVENLMKNPRGLLFKVANYDVTDETGRNFAYSSQETNDRTASITIDFGEGRVESYRIATFSEFDPATGLYKGITMRYALTDILNIDYETKDVDYDATSVLALYSIESIETDEVAHQAWVIFSSTELNDEDNFDDIVLHAGDNYSFAYLRDEDADGLFAREEYLYGSDDNDTNSDNDSLSDFDEIRTGWLVSVVATTSYQGYSNPGRDDSDGGGIIDHDEMACGTDAMKRDTDEDGLTDYDELNGYAIRFKDDDAYTELTPGGPTCMGGGTAYVTDPLNPDTDGDGISDGFEVKIGADPRVADANKFIDTDQDGLSDFEEESGFDSQVNGVSQSFTSSKYDPDSDGDGLPDLLEHLIGSNPKDSNDTDGDGLKDFDEFDPNTFEKMREFTQRCDEAERCTFDEVTFISESELYGTSLTMSDTDNDTLSDKFELIDGWIISVDTGSGILANSTVHSDPLDANSDTDGWNDGQEYNSGTDSTDPHVDDTDGDGDHDDAEGRSTICANVNGCRRPNIADQRVTVNYSSLYVGGDGDGSGATADANGEITAILVSDLEPFGGNEVSGDHWHIAARPDQSDLWLSAKDGDTIVFSDHSSVTVWSYIKPFSEQFRISWEIGETDSPSDPSAPLDFVWHAEHIYPTGKITSANASGWIGSFTKSHSDEDDCDIFGGSCDDQFDVTLRVTVSVD